MQRSEIFLAAVLAVLIISGTVYETMRGAGKTAEFIITRNARSPFAPNPTPQRPPVETVAGVPSETTELIIPKTYSNDPLMVFLNFATEAQLVALDGIGEKTAQDILRERARIGLFRTQDQVLAIDGIGPEKIKSIREQVLLTFRVEGSQVIKIVPTVRIPVRRPPLVPLDVAPPTPTRSPVLSMPVDLNRATLEDLMAVSGIGQQTAETILHARQVSGGFKNWREVEAVPGIGDKRLRQIQERFYLREKGR